MLLKDKVAVIYGAGGGVGSAIARAFARDGVMLFLTGRHRTTVDKVAGEISSAGGRVETAEVDVLDEQSVDKHLQFVTGKAGRVDVSFNAVGIPNTAVQGRPMVDLAVEQFSLPIATYTTSYFLTARLAARRMMQQKSGVIMTVTAVPSRSGIPMLGGFAPARAAVEALTRGLSAELAPYRIRVVGLRPDGMPETETIKEVFGIHAKAMGISWEQFHELIAGKNHRRRLATLEELGNMAVFMASDRASAMTGSIINLSMGMLDTYDDSRPLGPWLFRVAHNQCIDFLRRRGVRVEAEAAVAEPGIFEPAEPFGTTVGPALEHLVSILPPKERACVLLKDIFEYSLEEIAGLVDSTVGGVKAALNRGRLKLAFAESRPPAPRTPTPENQKILQLYVERFNRRDWDGLRELISADARLLVADRYAGLFADGGYLGVYSRMRVTWRLTMGEVDGAPSIILLHLREGEWEIAGIVHIDFAPDGKIQRISDYQHCPWVLTAGSIVVRESVA